MDSNFNLEIVAPERKFFEGKVEQIIIKTPQGEMGVLKGHVPMVVAVAVGSIKIKQDGEWKEAVLTEGFMEITQEKTVIFTDTAEWPEEIDLKRAEEAKKRAEERMQRKVSEMELLRSRAAMARAMERIKARSKKE